MAALERFDDPAAFRARAQDALLAREPENNLLFGILYGIEAGRYEDFRLWALGDAFAVRTPPHRIVLSHADPVSARALGAAIEDDAPGVGGEAEQALAFAEAWTARTGGSFALEMAQGIYALDRVEMPVRVSGSARPAEERDRSWAVEWLIAFEVEAVHADLGDREANERRFQTFLDDPWAELLVWEVAGEPVAMAARVSPTPNGIRVGPVYTPAEHRGKGYGSAVTAAVSARALERGHRFCFLYTDLANPTSNAIYQRIGYRRVCDAAVYDFG